MIWIITTAIIQALRIGLIIVVNANSTASDLAIYYAAAGAANFIMMEALNLAAGFRELTWKFRSINVAVLQALQESVLAVKVTVK